MWSYIYRLITGFEKKGEFGKILVEFSDEIGPSLHYNLFGELEFKIREC